MSNQDTLTEFNTVLEEWKNNQTTGADPIPNIKRMTELIELETEAYFKMDPDPFDDRHPGRANPTCTLGHMMKSLFKNEDFMNKLVGTYLMSPREEKELHTMSCRLLLDVMPGLETSVVFQENEGVVEQLFQWAEHAEDPLRSYATGLLAGAMDLQDIAANFKEQNSVTVPLMLRRLHFLQKIQVDEMSSSRECEDDRRYFSMFGKDKPNPSPSPSKSKQNGEADDLKEERKLILKRALSPSHYSDDIFHLKQKRIKYSPGVSEADLSNSSWAEMQPYVIGSYSMEPLTTTMKQRMILQYLIPMGEYQELLGTTFEHSALDLIFFYINLRENRDVRLAFEALKYLATLLCHKKFAIEFLSVSGVQHLLEVPRPSIAATGVSLCVYYLSYFEDAMERVCLLPDNILSDLVGYVMWLMECSHDSSRCHAAMFFSQVFPFKVMLDLFDQRDGLRRLFNVISTLSILNVEERPNMTEVQIFTMQQAARHVCGALKKYFEAHQALKAEEIRLSHIRTVGSASPIQETPAYKPMKLTPEVIQDNTEVLMELLPLRSHWAPEETFHHLGGVQLLTQLVAMAPEWSNYPGKPETIKNALDAISVCMVTPKSQSILLDPVRLPDDISTPAISVIIGLAEGEILADADVQKSALNVLVNCVCGPMERVGGGVGRIVGSGPKKKLNWKHGEDILSRVWNGIRTNNGIMVLLKLLSTKTPITDADTIRGLACRALVGLSRSESVRQIINKLPLFNNGQLQSLMKEPVLQDKRQEHIKFCKYASDLLERVSGKQPSSVGDASLEEIRRADIVAQTKIIFQERELLQLMHDHLLVKGYTESAYVLQREASLSRCITPPPPLHPSSPHLFSSPSTSRLSRQMSQPSTSHNVASTSVTTNFVNHLKESPTTPGPMKLTVNKHQPSPPSATFQQKVQLSKLKYLREKENSSTSPSVKLKSVGKPSADYDISLDKIVTEYLRKQHALCRNPVVTCPPMSLFLPHRCPEPKGWSSAPTCITSRLMRRSVFPPYGGLDGTRSNRKFIYTKFRPVRTYHDGEDDGFVCCSFSGCENQLMLGTFSGDIKVFSISTGEETESFTCHATPIIHLEPSRDDKLVLTSTWGTRQDSSLWRRDSSVENVFTFDDHYSEFSKCIQDKVIGTIDETAHIYDVTTGEMLMTLFDGDKANNYKDNIATFNPTDELVLNDGVLWDVRQRKAIHKFDKFNSQISGVFHPMGLEIIINSEVWDIRTFHLLHTVQALDKCQIKFNHTGDVIYATRFDDDNENLEDRYRSLYGSTLRTFDATDYSSIGTMDLKTKSIFDLCTDSSDCFLAVVETQQFSETATEESVCRLYEVGKLRDAEDDQEEEEEEEAGGGDDDDDEEEEDEEDDDISNILESLGDDGTSDENQDEGGDNLAFEGEEYSPSSDNLQGDDDDNDDDLDDDLLFELV